MADRDDKDLIGRGEDESPRPVEVHGLDRNGRRLDLERRGATHARLDRRGCRRRGASGRAHFRANQRQPYRLSSAAKPRPERHAHRGDRQDQGDADAARLPRPYRRYQPPLQGGAVGRRRSDHQIGQQAGVLPARRARRRRRRQRQGLSRTLRQEHQGQGLVQLRSRRRALHRPDQRVRISTRLQIRRPRQNRRRAARMAGEGCQRALGEYADRADGPPAVVDDLRAVGLGHRRTPAARSAI